VTLANLVILFRFFGFLALKDFEVIWLKKVITETHREHYIRYLRFYLYVLNRRVNIK